MGRSFIDLATSFTRTNFLGYPFSLVICFFSERLFVSFCGFCILVAGPGLFFMFASLGGLHVGHFKTDTASRLRGRHTGIVLFNVVLDGWHLFIEHGMPLMI